MAVTVSSGLKHARSRLLGRLLGAGWAQRVRTAYIGLLGIVVAIGLALTGFAVQLGWPDLPPSPLPGPPAQGRTAVDAAVAVSSSPALRRGDRAVGESSGAGGERPGRDSGKTAPEGSNRVSAAREVAVPVLAPPSPGAGSAPAAKPFPVAADRDGSRASSPDGLGDPAGGARVELTDRSVPADPGPAASPPGKGNPSRGGGAVAGHVPPPHSAAGTAADDGPGPGNGRAVGHENGHGPGGGKGE